MANEFIIKINKDSKGNELSLTNMPFEAVEALNIFLTSLKDFANLQNKENVRFTLREGCIETAISYLETDEVIDKDINEVLNGTSENNDFIKIFKSIQNKVQLNGLDYSLLHKVNGIETDVTTIFKSKKFAYRRAPKKEWRQEILFIEGYLLENGGKVTTNLHVETSDDEYTIDSTRDEAKVARGFLFENIYLAIVKRYFEGEKPHYKYVDCYLTKEKFDFYKKFYTEIQLNTSLTKYDIIHDIITKNIRSEANIGELLKLMRLYNYSFSDRGIIRTILMTLKPIMNNSDNEKLKEMYCNLANTLRSGNKNNTI